MDRLTASRFCLDWLKAPRIRFIRLNIMLLVDPTEAFAGYHGWLGRPEELTAGGVGTVCVRSQTCGVSWSVV